MGYHVVDPDELEPEADRPSEMRYVSEAADMDHMGLRVYRVEPGLAAPGSAARFDAERDRARG